MSMQDPIADMLTRVRNAHARNMAEVRLPASKLKISIVTILEQEGYIAGFEVVADGHKKNLHIRLKYFAGKPVIETVTRVSKPSLRCYRGVKNIPNMRGGLGTVIVSTAQGVMTDKTARAKGIGGEILCVVA